jgi:hypothetical protein
MILAIAVQATRDNNLNIMVNQRVVKLKDFLLKDEQSAGQLRPVADESSRYRYVVMPMRI